VYCHLAWGALLLQGKPCCLLINKQDLPDAQGAEGFKEMLETAQLGTNCLDNLMVLSASALTGQGLPGVLHWIRAAMTST
jgi:signal recognition particle receptor subunit beta